MAKPRIFISSTFYDLKQIRIELDKFIESLGYEPVRNETGDIPYGKDEEIQTYCYKEIANVDILVSIIGGRYGSPSLKDTNPQEYSVSQKELITAMKEDKQVFIFIEKDVLTEYETYRRNKDNPDVNYNFVDNINIYKFIDEIKSLHNNNNIKGFETADDIKLYLREQLAGLFKQFLTDSNRIKQTSVLQDIENTAKNLRSLVDYLSQQNQEKGDDVRKIIMFNHPLLGKIREIVGIRYNFYVEGEKDLANLLQAYGYKQEGYTWTRTWNNKTQTISISQELFENGKLKYINQSEWNDSFITYSQKEDTPAFYNNDDLPF